MQGMFFWYCKYHISVAKYHASQIVRYPNWVDYSICPLS